MIHYKKRAAGPNPFEGERTDGLCPDVYALGMPWDGEGSRGRSGRVAANLGRVGSVVPSWWTSSPLPVEQRAHGAGGASAAASEAPYDDM